MSNREQPGFWTKTTVITAIVGAVIAVSALSVSLWQGCETRNFYRLSMRPNIEVTFVEVTDPITGQLPGIYVRNAGAGPATLTQQPKVSVCGKLVVPSSGESLGEAVVHALGLCAGLSDKLDMWNRSLPPESTTLTPGQEIWFVRMTQDSNYTLAEKDSIMASLRTVTMEISYKSVYDEQFTYSFEPIHRVP